MIKVELFDELGVPVYVFLADERKPLLRFATGDDRRSFVLGGIQISRVLEGTHEDYES